MARTHIEGGKKEHRSAAAAKAPETSAARSLGPARTRGQRPTVAGDDAPSSRVDERTGPGASRRGASSAETEPPPDRRLEVVLRALPPSEVDALVERVGISIDPTKRIDKVAQIARALVRSPELRDPSRLPSASVELLRRVAEAGGALVVSSVPVGLEPLVRRALLFARHAPNGGAGIELVLPTAMLVQLKSWDSEDPRSIRSRLSEASFEAASAIASHYLGRPATPPVALALEAAGEALGDRVALAKEVAKLSFHERRLLEQLEQIGCEVDTQELMDVEREPMRVRGVYGVAAGRRGAAFALEKRGFLFHVPPNRYVVPSEVAAIIGAERRLGLETRREKIRTFVAAEDHLPRRARFSKDPAPACLALALFVRSEGLLDVRPGVGTPRSAVARMAQKFGCSLEDTAFFAALSRAAGLWDAAASSSASPPGTLLVGELGACLFDTWRAGAAWDEARPERELLRVPLELRDPSPVSVIRTVVMTALRDLGEHQWVGVRELLAYMVDDARIAGARRLLARWAKRTGVEAPDPIATARTIVLESLHALGAVDVGGGERGAADGDDSELALRVTARGRELFARCDLPCSESFARRASDPSHMVERVLKVGGDARIAALLELAPFVEVSALEPGLEVELSAAGIARGLALGICVDEMHRRLQAIAPVSETAERALVEAGTVLGSGAFVPACGFLWVEDRELCALLRSRASVAEQFVEPSPPGGLLIAPGVDVERLVRRCRALGIEIHGTEGVLRARRPTIPPLPEGASTMKRVSAPTPGARTSA